MNKEQVLSNCTVEGNLVKLPEVQLDRKIYIEVKKSLELIGGKWKGGKTQAFVFPTDPKELLKSVASGDKKNLKKEYQFFGTPKNLAKHLVSLAELQENDNVLEPSAGQGALIAAINEACNVVPDCYELMDVNRKVLSSSELSYNMIGSDFLQNNKSSYSKIIANPPFTKNQDIDHLMEMYKLLKKGGRLVCITSETWRNGSQKKQIAFRKWLNEVYAKVITIDRGSFKESGTMVGGNIVIINK